MTAESTAAKNRAMLLTGSGAVAIAVVRFIGPGISEFLRTHFDKPTAARRCVHGVLRDGEEVIDDPVVAVDEAFADINVHGGPWVVQRVLQLARDAGFDTADSFAPDSDFADGDSIIEREIAAYMPLARTELAIRELLRQREAWAALPERLSPEMAREMLADRNLYWLLHPPRVAIVGAPNVGKSTLANQLFGQERSIVADLPGTTRDWVGEFANIDGLAVMLVDTPGIRGTSDAVEAIAIEQSKQEIAAAELVLLLLDVTMPLRDQTAVLEQFPSALRLANKSDRPAAWELPGATYISAARGDGVDAVRRQILQYFMIPPTAAHVARWWTPRQKNWLKSNLHG